MTEVQARWFRKAEERLSAAKVCAREGYVEAACSGAYYVMFYVVTALMLEEGKRFKSHSAIMSAFHTSWIKAGKIDPEYHRYLTNAFDERNNSDYDLIFEERLDSAMLLVERAEAFLNMGRKTLGGEATD